MNNQFTIVSLFTLVASFILFSLVSILIYKIEYQKILTTQNVIINQYNMASDPDNINWIAVESAVDMQTDMIHRDLIITEYEDTLNFKINSTYYGIFIEPTTQLEWSISK